MIEKKGFDMRWLEEGIREFLKLAWEDIKDTPPRNRRAKHLIALPVIGRFRNSAQTETGDFFYFFIFYFLFFIFYFFQKRIDC